LAFGPIITLGLAFINVFGALVFLFAIFPYLFVVYFSKNSQKIESYLKELSSTEETDQDIGEAVSYSSVVGKVIIYSVLFVLLYIAIEALLKLLFCKFSLRNLIFLWLCYLVALGGARQGTRLLCVVLILNKTANYARLSAKIFCYYRHL